MHTQYYNDIKIDYKDDEWKRLQEIKAAHAADPWWLPPPIPRVRGERKGGTQLSIKLPDKLKDKISRYAFEHNISSNEVVRNVMEVFFS